MFEGRLQSDGASSATNWEEKVKSFFDEQLNKPGAVEKVASLNQVANHHLRDGQLASFRCMVQDMFDPEFYLGSYRVKNLADGTIVERTGRFRDMVQCGPREELLDTSEGQTRDRLSYYAVSIPGEAAWISDHHSKTLGDRVNTSGASVNPLKRSLEEEEDMETEGLAEAANGQVELKKSKAEESNGKPSEPNSANGKMEKPKLGLNLPLPHPNGRAAIIKLYDLNEGDIKLNDMIEVVGIVSLDPGMAAGGDESDEDGFSNIPSLPPPSMVPRLHVLTHRVLSHPNPLPLDPSPEPGARQELLAILTECLLGDKLAAEYLLAHLVSSVYLRKDVLVLGKFSLNLHNMTPHDNLPRRLATVLSLLTTASYFLPLSRDHLDTSSFLPKKDFEANRLVTGLLQLAKGTQLIIDETAMTDGQLTAQGLANLTALGNVITWQRAEYDFKFQKLEYDTDIPCLVLSEGRSMLPSDLQLMLKPDCKASADVITEKYSGVGSYLTAALLTKLRTFLTQCREASFNLTEEMMKGVQGDFVAMRQAAGGITVEDFHNLLVLARLVAKGHGRDSLLQEDWEKAKSMEVERKSRVTSLPPRPGANFANGVPMHL